MSYKIVRMFMNGPSRTIMRGLTLEEAKEYCKDPETSSMTCTSSVGLARGRLKGPWFDAFDEE
jgi:hypothetical protein